MPKTASKTVLPQKESPEGRGVGWSSRPDDQASRGLRHSPITPRVPKTRTPNLLYAKRDASTCGGQYQLTEAGYELIEFLSSRATENLVIAKELGMSGETFRVILKKDQRAADCLALGRAQLSTDIGHSLYRQAVGGENQKPNVIAGIFLAKARCGWSDRGDRPMEGVKTLNQVNITMGSPLTSEEWSKVVDGTRKLIAPKDEGSDG